MKIRMHTSKYHFSSFVEQFASIRNCFEREFDLFDFDFHASILLVLIWAHGLKRQTIVMK